MIKWFAAICAVVISTYTHANTWLICDYKIKVLDVNKSEVRAEIFIAAKKNPDTCLKRGSEINFKPESEDYQSELPKKHWPKSKKILMLRYRELSGFCKNDGYERFCTITHYSIMH